MFARGALTDLLAITDNTGMPQFEVQVDKTPAVAEHAFSKKMSVRDTAGAEVAAISRLGLLEWHEIVAGGQRTIVRPRGFLRQYFEIDSPAGRLEARGKDLGSVTRGGVPAAQVTQLGKLSEWRFAIEVTDGEDSVLMLAVVLVIEAIRTIWDERPSASSGFGPGFPS